MISLRDFKLEKTRSKRYEYTSKESFANHLFESIFFEDQGRSWRNSSLDMKQGGKGTWTVEGKVVSRNGRCDENAGEKLIERLINTGGENWERQQGAAESWF